MVSRTVEVGPKMAWQKTTLRKGTKDPKICRDMFITESYGEFNFAEVKNGSISFRKRLSEKEALEIIESLGLVGNQAVFAKSYTYRDPESSALVKRILSEAFAKAKKEYDEANL